MKKLTKDPEYYIIVAATGLCVLVSILDFSGLLSAIPWLSQKIPTFMLLMLSTVLGYLVVERRNKLDGLELLTQRKSEEILASIAEGKKEITTLIQRGDICLFERPEDTYSYFIKRIHGVNRSIDVTHFSSNRPPKPDQTDIPSRHQYYEILSKAVKERNVRIRRVFLVENREHIEWIKEVLTEFSGCPFYLGCYRPP